MHNSIKDKDILEHSALDYDRFDRRVFEHILEFEHEVPTKVREQIEQDNTVHSSMLFDVFGSFYKMLPRVRADKKDSMLGQVVEEIMDTSEYNDLRSYTTLDDFASALASFKFVPELRDEQKKFSEMRGSEDADELSMGDEAEARYAVRQALKKTKEYVEEMVSAMSGVGQEPGKFGYDDPAEALKIAKKLEQNPNLRRIAEIAGRMKIVAKKMQKEKVRRGVGAVVGVEIGNDIPLLLPVELFKFRRMRKVFFKDFLERKLQQYDVEAEEDLGKGPIVCCIDCSYSMSGRNHDWAKAVALALTFIATQQKRSMYMIAFDTVIKSQGTLLKNGKVDIEQVHHLTKISATGGTSFYEPFRKAYDFIENQDKDFKKADIVFITDGICDVGPEQVKKLNKSRNRHGVDVYSFLIGGGEVGVLKELSSQIYKVYTNELSEQTDGLKTIFAI